MHAAPIAIEQAHSGAPLDLLDAARQGRLGEAELLGRLGVAEATREDGYVTEAAKVHSLYE
jgi:hypothetical protein